MSDESSRGFLTGLWKPLNPLNLFYTTATWQLDVRLWKSYPSHALLPLTTWEEEKPATILLFTEGFCDDLRSKYFGKAAIVQRFKNNEMWKMDETSF